ncbi:hypothetical protein [Mangrovibrevibacter kandeliae]|uniref:hypothetical protein n=1 Tax=Mangrovibrevibacter kandeliae TaxID=2968473 RepID=UPI002118F2E6|nr:hypothetical protein [Aurantimonas sp. CSK15Z-1]MCQ8780913.1 hypothetical protein [Aurantimonas sp. CSK15Z-1]
MLDIRNRHTAARERALADGIKEVVAELRLVDVTDYIAFIRLERFANIADLIRSSSELHLKPGALRFGFGGDVELTWSSSPLITLDMEFQYEPVSAHFRLELGAANAAVDLEYLAIDDPDPNPDVNTERLRMAIDAARLVPLRPAVSN